MHINLGSQPSSDSPGLEPGITQLSYSLYHAQLACYNATVNLNTVESNLHHAALVDPALMPKAQFAYDALCQTLALAASPAPTPAAPGSGHSPPLGIAGQAALGSLALDGHADKIDFARFKATFLAHFPGSEHLFRPATGPNGTSPVSANAAAAHNGYPAAETSIDMDGVGRLRSNGASRAAHGGRTFVPSMPFASDAAKASYFSSVSGPDGYDGRPILPVPSAFPGIPRAFPHAPTPSVFTNGRSRGHADDSTNGTRAKRRASPSPTRGDTHSRRDSHDDADTSNLSLIVAAAESASRSTIPTPVPNSPGGPALDLPRPMHARGNAVNSPAQDRTGSSAMQLLIDASRHGGPRFEQDRARRGGSVGGSEGGLKRLRGPESGSEAGEYYDDDDDDDDEFEYDGDRPVARSNPSGRSKPRARQTAGSRLASRAGSLSSLVGEAGASRSRQKDGDSASGSGTGKGKARRQPRMMEYDPNSTYPLNQDNHFLVVQTKFGQPELSDRACTELYLLPETTEPDSPYGRTIIGNKAPYTAIHYSEDINRGSQYTFASASGARWHVSFTPTGPTITPAVPGGAASVLSPGTVCTFIRFPPGCFTVMPNTPLGSLPWWRTQACTGLAKHRGMPGPEGAWTARYDKDPRDRRPARIVEHFARCRWRSDEEAAGIGGDPVGKLARAVLGSAAAEKGSSSAANVARRSRRRFPPTPPFASSSDSDDDGLAAWRSPQRSHRAQAKFFEPETPDDTPPPSQNASPPSSPEGYLAHLRKEPSVGASVTKSPFSESRTPHLSRKSPSYGARRGSELDDEPILPRVKLAFPTSEEDDDDDWKPNTIRQSGQRTWSQTTTTSRVERHSWVYSMPALQLSEDVSKSLPSDHNSASKPKWNRRPRRTPMTSSTLASSSPDTSPARTGTFLAYSSRRRSPSTSSTASTVKPTHPSAPRRRYHSAAEPLSTKATRFFSPSSPGGPSNKEGSQTLPTPPTPPALQSFTNVFFVFAIAAFAFCSVSAVLVAGFGLTIYDDVVHRLRSAREQLGQSHRLTRAKFDSVVRGVFNILYDLKCAMLDGVHVVPGLSSGTRYPDDDYERRADPAAGSTDGSRWGRKTTRPHRHPSSSPRLFAQTFPEHSSPLSAPKSRAVPSSIHHPAEESNAAKWVSDEDAMPYDVPNSTPYLSRTSSPSRVGRPHLPPRPPLVYLLPSILLAIIIAVVKMSVSYLRVRPEEIDYSYRPRRQ